MHFRSIVPVTFGCVQSASITIKKPDCLIAVGLFAFRVFWVLDTRRTRPLNSSGEMSLAYGR